MFQWVVVSFPSLGRENKHQGLVEIPSFCQVSVRGDMVVERVEWVV